MYYRYYKRFWDITGSTLLLLIFAWVFLLIFLVYVISSSTPVIFKHRRLGRNQKSFYLYKFRTLNGDSNLPLTQRTFPLGTFLRCTSLDELPQLINVLRGEMSLIGPRPLPVEYLPLFNSEQLQRHQIRPGITGWAQVNGRHSISWEKKFEYDLYYLRNASFWFDLRIALRTIILLISLSKDRSLQEVKFGGDA